MQERARTGTTRRGRINVPFSRIHPSRVIDRKPAMRRLVALPLILVATLTTPLCGQEATVDFAREVYPILRKACFDCHGPEKQRGKLRLDDRAAALRTIVP